MSTKKNGLRIALRRANSTNVHGTKPDARTKQHVNIHTCGTCGAKPGEPCFTLGATRYRELNRTHSGIEVRRDEQKPPTTPPTAEELASRKRSTESLDRRHQARKAREAANERKRNGL